MNNTLNHSKRITKLKRLTKNFLLTGLLLLIGVTAKAQTYYVFYNATYGYIYNNSGTPSVSTTFTKSAIWAASGELMNANNSNRTIKSYTATSQYMNGGNTADLTLGNSSSTWRLRSTSNVLNWNNNSNGYVHYNGSKLVCSNGNTRFTPYNITIGNPAVVNPTISITAASGLSNGGIQLTGNVTGTYAPACNSAVVRNYNANSTQTYYWTSSTEASTTRPGQVTDWSNATKSWAVTTGGTYASVSNDGLVTITGNPTGNVVVTLTVSKDGYEGTQTFTLTRAAAAQATNTVSTINDFSVSPNSAALYVSENQTFTASATVDNTTYTTPAHTTLTGGGNTYHYYNGTLYANTEDFSPSSSTTATPTFAWSMTGEGSSNASLSATSGASTTLTHTPGVSSDKSLTLTVEASYTGATSQSQSVPVSLYAPFVSPTITRSGNNIILSTTSLGATIYYTTDGSTPSASNGTAYTTPINLESLTLPVTIKTLAVRGSESTSVAQQTYSTLSLEKPVISISSAGAVTITSSTAGASIRYTTGGTNPSSSSGTVYNGSFNVSNLTTVKAIAYKNGYTDSEIASETYITSGTSGTMVILNDREDHSWSYYSDADQPIRSLSPADVKITYYGDGIMMTGNNDYTASSTDYIISTHADYIGGAKVNVGGENENTFVYYKTLERGAATDAAWTYSAGNQSSAASRCPYTPIYNPFQVRPTYTGTETTNTADWSGWRGFQCWRLKSVTGGSVYSADSGESALSTGAVIEAGKPIYFAPNSEYGMEVEFEAVWARAYVVKTNNTDDAMAIGNHSSLGYERNFIILNTTNVSYNFGGTSGKRITNIDRQVTVTRYLPNGVRGQNNDATYIRGAATSYNLTLEANTKFENVAFNMGSNTFTAANHDVIIGRGCTGSVGTLRGISGDADDLDYTLRVESGTFGQFDFVAEVSCTVSGRVQVKSILGCDYDRAKGTNTNLSVANQNNMFFTRDVAFSNSSNKDQKVLDLVIKSGEFQKGYWDTDENQNGTTGTNGFNYVHSMYCGANFGSGNPTHYPGIRCVTIEGGAIGNINGGRGTSAAGNNGNPDATTTQTAAWKVSFDLRIKNDAIINGCVFGGAANTSAWGSKRIVLTGGKVYSWIAGGANGTSTDNGDSRTRGTSYIYVGGNAEVGGPNAKMKNSTLGGQVFGAGRGFTNQAASMDTTFVVIADNAKIMKKNNDASGNVYGGGNIGYTHKQSNIYILGGTIEGSVYGGAFSNALDIPEVNITMRGGLVEGGVYGGSNSSGTISGNVTMHIDGGQVGTSSVNANVHGGGLGEPTRVKGNVDVNLGTCNATSGVTVFGDVYGGSAMGKVNTDNTNATTVSLYKGTIYGGLYGGGYGPGGEDADVNGAVAVNVYGGSVLCSADDPDGEAGTGSVFGCNNISGTPISTVEVNIYGTDQPESGYALHAVYGGGNKAAYTGVPVVTIHGCSNSIEYVYGGGNATDVKGTDVTIWGGNIGNAFGGGNGYSVTGNHTNASAAHYNPGANITSDGTLLNIYGGTIGAAFGGSNQFGRINSTIKVNVEAKTENNSDPCSGNAYTACPMDIEELYGGGNEAPIQTSTNEWIVPTVKLDCSANIGMLFGGAKAADYGQGIDLVVEGGTFRKVFGGNNKGGTINGNVSVTFKGGTAGAVYGGCNESGTITGTLLVEIDSTNTSCGTFHVGDVYGGGDMAAYTAPTATPNYPIVNIKNGTINGSVYGGGKGATATVKGNPVVTIGDNSNANKYVIVTGNVYGGGDAAPVTGSTSITYNDANAKSKVDKLFGGGNQASVSSTATVTLTSGKVISGIYGGCNASGGVTGDIAVKINGGTVGSSSTLANIHGGGYGSGTFTGSNVTVTIGNGGEGPNIWGDVYGGSALGNVNADDASLTTKVWLKKGTVNGSLYGGGLGDASNPASVNGNVEVIVDGGSIKKIGTNPASVFGCNNINGSPKRNVTVTINASEATTLDGEGHKVYAINGVYGGGNLAHYDPTTPGDYPQVIINGCETSIKDVYGGGNAAAVPYTKVTVNGGDINRVFAGGNGESGTPANVGYKNTDANPTTDSYGAGTANAIIKGGTINQVFGGSNSNGIIRESNSVNISQGTEAGACPLNLVQLYGGGNMAPGPAGEITIGCTGDQTIDYIYGGANQADVTGDIILNIEGGRFNNVYGGNNISGTVHGKIIVNVDWKGDCDNYLGNVYGGGNLAPYTAPGDPSNPDDPNWNYPQVNIKNGVVSGNVYGGGNGDPTSTTQEPGSVTGNPQVTIGYLEDTERHVTVRGNVYGGGNAAKVTGDTFILMKNKSKVLSNIYGGGNMAPVSGNTKVIVNGKTN